MAPPLTQDSFNAMLTDLQSVQINDPVRSFYMYTGSAGMYAIHSAMKHEARTSSAERAATIIKCKGYITKDEEKRLKQMIRSTEEDLTLAESIIKQYEQR